MSKELTAYPTLDSLVEETINRNLKAKDSQQHYECVEHDKIKASFFKDDVDYYSQVETALKEYEKYKKAIAMLKDNISLDFTRYPQSGRYEVWLNNGEEEPIRIADTKEEYELLKEILK